MAPKSNVRQDRKKGPKSKKKQRKGSEGFEFAEGHAKAPGAAERYGDDTIEIGEKCVLSMKGEKAGRGGDW